MEKETDMTWHCIDKKQRDDGTLPCHDNDEVHHVPDVPKIWTLVQNESQGDNFEQRLDAENTKEVHFGLFLSTVSEQLMHLIACVTFMSLLPATNNALCYWYVL